MRPAAAEPAIPEYDLEGLLGWDRKRAAERAREERTLRDRVLARDREMELERRRIARMAGASNHLSDMLAAMLARPALDADGFVAEQGPVLDPLTGLPQVVVLTLRVFSFEMMERAQPLHAQQGDKIILPAEALYQVQKLRLPFPLLFRLEKLGTAAEQRRKADALRANPDSGSIASPGAQYAGVLEFSAPAEQAFLPHWMMENLRVEEGESIRVYSESHLPQGKWIKLEPHSQSFSTLLRELGPKYFLENALRHYSVLSKGQRIMVSHAGQNYSLNVRDCKPADTVSLLGNLDLEVEFGPAIDAPRGEREGGDGSQTFRTHASGVQGGAALGEDDDEDLKRAMAMSLAESGASPAAAAAAASDPAADGASVSASPVADDEGWAVAEPVAASSSAAPSSLASRFGGGGNRLGGPSSSAASEAKYPEASPSASPVAGASASSSAAPTSAESKEEQEALEADGDSGEDEQSMDAADPPLEAVDVPPGHQLCPTCNRAITTASYSLHSLHCARAFTKCAVCARMVKKVEAEAHAASHARVECPACHMELESKRLRKHTKRECVYRPAPCKWCAGPTPLIQLPSHEAQCGDVTELCSLCAQPIPRRLMQVHPSSEACRVQCGKCDEIVTSRDIVAHTKDRCSGRMLECPHCKLQVVAREQRAHEDYCGARTDACDKCKRYVKLRDMQRHIDSACTYPPPAEAKPAPSAAAPPASSAARASPSLGLGLGGPHAAAARMGLLAAMADRDDPLDSSIMAALLSQTHDLGDPLASAAARNSRSNAAANTRQSAAAARSQRGRDLASDDSDEEFAPMRQPVARKHSGSSAAAPKPAPPAHASSSQRAPSPSVARASAPAAGPAGSSFTCAHCNDKCASLESLQVHILTECSEAHAKLEAADPAAAAKALAGQSIKEHVNMRVPVAKLASKPSAATVSSASPPAAAPAAAPFDPYDMSWRKPARQASEELRRHTAARKFVSPTKISSDDDSDAADGSSDEEDLVRAVHEMEMNAARKASKASAAAAAAATVPARPTLKTTNPKLRANLGNSASSASRPAAIVIDDDDEPPRAAAARLASNKARTPFTATPLSVKQQQHDLQAAISARKAAAAALSAASPANNKPPGRLSAAPPRSDDYDDYDADPIVARYSSGGSAGASAASPAVASKRPSGGAGSGASSGNARAPSGSGFQSRPSGVSPSFMAGLGSAPPAVASRGGSSGAPMPFAQHFVRDGIDPVDFEESYEKLRGLSAAAPAPLRKPIISSPVRVSSSSAAASSSAASRDAASRSSRADVSPLAAYLANNGSKAGAGGAPASASSLSSYGSSLSGRGNAYADALPMSSAYAASTASSSSSSAVSRDRLSFDRPLQHSSARPPSPPSHQKASVSSSVGSGSIGSGLKGYGGLSGASYGAGSAALPSRSAYGSSSAAAPVASSSRVRGTSASRSAAAASNPHVPERAPVASSPSQLHGSSFGAGARKATAATRGARQ